MQYVIGVIFIVIFVVVCMCTSSWFSVARIHTTIWFFIYWGYLISTNDTGFIGYGPLWIIFSCLFILLGEKTGEQCISVKPYPLHSYTVKCPRRFWIVVIVCLTTISLFGNILEVYAYGFGVGDFLSFKKILNMSHKIATLRYSGIEISSIITLLQTQKYIASLLSGYYFFSCKNVTNRIVCILPVFPIVLNVLIENTKAGVIACTILFFIGLIISFVSVNLKCPKFTLKIMLKIMFWGCLLVAFLIFAMVIRLGKVNSETIGVVLEKFKVYAFGNVQAFDLWLSDWYRVGDWRFGVNTFMAPFNLLGIVSREQGVYGFIDGAASNVFSGYRGVIEDFGILGGLVFVMILGVIGGRCLKKMMKSPLSIGPKIGYCFILFFVVYSYIISPYIYSSFCITIIEFVILLYVEKRFYNNKQSINSKELATDKVVYRRV